MVFENIKMALDNAVVKLNNVFKFGKKKLEFSEQMKDKLIKIAYLILDVFEEVGDEAEESKKEVTEL